MNQGPLIEEDYSLYKQLVDLWQKENPIKTNKLQVLLVVNGLLLTAVNLSGGFLPKNWPIYLGGAFFSLVWVISIGRTSLFQKIWEIKIKSLAERHSQDARFQVLDYRQAIKETPGWLRFFGGVSSKYYLIGAPFLFCVVWFLILVYFLTFATAGPPASPVSKTIRYSHAGQEFVGYLAYPGKFINNALKRQGHLLTYCYYNTKQQVSEDALGNSLSSPAPFWQPYGQRNCGRFYRWSAYLGGGRLAAPGSGPTLPFERTVGRLPARFPRS